MSFHQHNIEAFISLLRTKPKQNAPSGSSLFSAQDRASLEKLVTSLPDDEEKLSEAIASWYEQRPKILDAQLDILNTLLTDELKATREMGGNVFEVDFKNEKSYKETLLSLIRQGSGE
jgi:hypothetical protein